MDEIDKVLRVVDATKPTYAMSHRLLALGIFLVSLEVTMIYYYLSLFKLYVAWYHQVMIAIFYYMLTHTSPAPYQSKATFQDSIPSQPWLIMHHHFFRCRFLGAEGKLDRLIMNWRKNRKRWYVHMLPASHCAHSYQGCSIVLLFSFFKCFNWTCKGNIRQGG